MTRHPTRRELLLSGTALAASTGLPTAAASATRQFLYRDDFLEDPLSAYDVSFRSYPVDDGAPTGGTPADGTPAGGAISWSPADDWVHVESPRGTEAVIVPPVKPPETGHVHLRLDVVRNNAPTNKVAVRLVESDDRWVELAGIGDGDRFAIVDHRDDGETMTVELGPEPTDSGRHAADLFWSPTERAVYVDGDFVGSSSQPEGTYDFTPRRIEFRNVQNDTRLRFWQLDRRTPPDDSFEDLETPVATPTSTPTYPPTGTATPTPREAGGGPPDTGPATESYEQSSSSDPVDWLGSLAPLVVPLIGVPVLGTVVLGAALAVSRSLDRADD